MNTALQFAVFVHFHFPITTIAITYPSTYLLQDASSVSLIWWCAQQKSSYNKVPKSVQSLTKAVYSLDSIYFQSDDQCTYIYAWWKFGSDKAGEMKAMKTVENMHVTGLPVSLPFSIEMPFTYIYTLHTVSLQFNAFWFPNKATLAMVQIQLLFEICLLWDFVLLGTVH
jgi:hypothetical protein